MKVDQSINLAEAANAEVAAMDDRASEINKTEYSEKGDEAQQQDGVRQAEAITQSWSKGALMTMFGL